MLNATPLLLGIVLFAGANGASPSRRAAVSAPETSL